MHTQGKTQRDTHRKAFGHCHHDKSDSYHQGIERILGKPHPVDTIADMVIIDEIHHETGHHDDSRYDIAVTLIVVAVPEGLPMSVTLSLALSMHRMLSANNLVRKMHACETMGAATVICTDKTGTLTQNQMSVNDVLTYCKSTDILKESIAVNTTAYLDFTNKEKIKAIGNPTEGALLLWLYNQGVNYYDYREDMKLLQQVPFSTKYKFMATVVDSKTFGKPMFYVKGALEIVLAHCNKILTDDGIVDIGFLICQSKGSHSPSAIFKQLALDGFAI